LFINGKHELLGHVSDVTLLVGPETDAKKTKYMFMCRHKSEAQNHN